jgi:LacI family transcriptional regulator
MIKLIDSGFENIFVVYYVNGTQERLEGVKKACEIRAFKMSDEDFIACDHNVENVYKQVLEALEKRKCNALFSLENTITVGSLKAISKLKLELNKDIYLLGFDDIHIYNFLVPEIVGVIHQPLTNLCRSALDILLDRIKKRTEMKRRWQIIRLEGEIKI